MKKVSYLILISAIFAFGIGGILVPTAFAASSFNVTTVSDFNAGASSGVAIADVGGGDGSVTNTLGAETLDQSYITGTTKRSFDNTNWISQTFTAGQNGFLTKVNIRLDRNNSNNTDGAVTVEIRDTGGGSPGSIVLAGTSTAASFINKNGATDYDFIFDSQPAVSAGTVYAIVVYRSGPGTITANYNWYSGSNAAAAYAAGGRYTSSNSGSSWSLQNSGLGDLRFNAYYKAYTVSGTQSSAVLDTDSNATEYGQISWNETLPAGSDIIFEVRVSADSFAKTDVLPDWINLGPVNSPINLDTVFPDAYQYLQWRATLIGTATVTPILPDVAITYNRPPTLTAIGNQTTEENQLLTFTVSGSDPDNDTLIYSASNLPSGADFATSTQTFSWTPSYSQSGIYDSVHFEVGDGSAATSEDITITINNVNRPPTLDIIGNKIGNENEDITFTISASDPDDDFLTYFVDELPDGASFDEDTQIFSWTPDFNQSGNYSVIFTVSDDESEDSEEVPIDIGNVNRSPALSAIDNKTVNENENLTFTVFASDLDIDTLVYSAGNLPDGASFDAATQIFSWMPSYSQSGSYDSVHFEVSDGSATDAEDISITVNNVNRTPVLNSIGNQSGSENTAITFIVSGSDPDSDTLIYSANNLPSGADFATSTQTFSWTPSYSQSGIYDSVHFEVSDGSAIISENITITITNTNRAPILDAIGNKTINENQPLTFTVSASDLDNDTLIYSATNLPSGASFDINTGIFSWKPDYSQAGDYSAVHFQVFDGQAIAGEDIAIKVNNVSVDDGGIFQAAVFSAPASAQNSQPASAPAPISLIPAGTDTVNIPVAVVQPLVRQELNQPEPEKLASALVSVSAPQVVAPSPEQNPANATDNKVPQEKTSLLANLISLINTLKNFFAGFFLNR